MNRYLMILGTRPEAVKLLPLARELRARGAELRILSTAQHTDMLTDVFRAFAIPPDETLTPLPAGRSVAEFLSYAIRELPLRIQRFSPECVIVQGDTASAYAGGLCAFLAGVRLAHVEAGLRTKKRYEPYPEELFRTMLADLSDYHFAPDGYAMQNLIHEGITEGIAVTGNTIQDAVRLFSEERDRAETPIVLLTVHRRESFGEGQREIFRAVRALAQRHPSVRVIYPVHKSRATRELAYEMLSGISNVALTDPLPLREFYFYLSGAALLMTDSGGVSEEGAALGIPTLVLRETTERVAELASGRITLGGTTCERILSLAEEMLNMPRAERKLSSDSPSRLIADHLFRIDAQ